MNNSKQLGRKVFEAAVSAHKLKLALFEPGFEDAWEARSDSDEHLKEIIKMGPTDYCEGDEFHRDDQGRVVTHFEVTVDEDDDNAPSLHVYYNEHCWGSVVKYGHEKAADEAQGIFDRYPDPEQFIALSA